MLGVLNVFWRLVLLRVLCRLVLVRGLALML